MRYTLVITAEQRDRVWENLSPAQCAKLLVAGGHAVASDYILARFLQDYGVKLASLGDPRLEFEELDDSSAVRITFDDATARQDPVRYGLYRSRTARARQPSTAGT